MAMIIDVRTPQEVVATNVAAAAGQRGQEQQQAPVASDGLMPGVLGAAGATAGMIGAGYAANRGFQWAKGMLGATPNAAAAAAPAAEAAAPAAAAAFKPAGLLGYSPQADFTVNAAGQAAAKAAPEAAAIANAGELSMLSRALNSPLGKLGMKGAGIVGAAIAPARAISDNIGMAVRGDDPETAMAGTPNALAAMHARDQHLAEMQAAGASPAAMMGANVAGSAKVFANQLGDYTGINDLAEAIPKAAHGVGDFFSGMFGGGKPAPAPAPAPAKGKDAPAPAPTAEKPHDKHWGTDAHPAASIYKMQRDAFLSAISGMNNHDLDQLMGMMAPPKFSQQDMMLRQMSAMALGQHQFALEQAKLIADPEKRKLAVGKAYNDYYSQMSGLYQKGIPGLMSYAGKQGGVD